MKLETQERMTLNNSLWHRLSAQKRAQLGSLGTLYTPMWGQLGGELRRALDARLKEVS